MSRERRRRRAGECGEKGRELSLSVFFSSPFAPLSPLSSSIYVNAALRRVEERGEEGEEERGETARPLRMAFAASKAILGVSLRKRRRGIKRGGKYVRRKGIREKRERGERREKREETKKHGREERKTSTALLPSE